jgi:hypothetical protein
MAERKSITAATRRRYRAASRKAKTKMLDEFVATTGYDRKYAAKLLTADTPPRQSDKGARPAAPLGRPRRYPPALRGKLVALWYLFDCLCGKRLAPLLRQTVPVLRELGECGIDDQTAAELVSISAASIDRLLADEKRRHRLRGSSITRPGAFLKRQIPIRTFADWNDAAPGFVEADLVAHDGGSSCGDFLCSFTMTDVATGWTEPVAQLNRAQKWTFQSIQTARERLPFPLLGFDSDNGSEFVNRFFVDYCRREGITFTRSRPYRKNDNCFVEQKNNSVIRRCVGYPRYESPEALEVLTRLYEQYRLLVNFFLPSAKLIVRTRDGSKVIRRHDAPRSPYDRVLDHPAVANADKDRLRKFKLTLNPARIARTVADLQRALVSVAAPINYVPNRWHLQGDQPHGKFSRLASS